MIYATVTHGKQVYQRAYKVKYNDNNQVIEIDVLMGVSVNPVRHLYLYLNENQIIEEKYSSDSPSQLTQSNTYILNSSSYVSQLIYNVIGQPIESEYYQYNSDDQLIEVRLGSLSFPISTFIYSSENCVKAVKPGISPIYTQSDSCTFYSSLQTLNYDYKYPYYAGGASELNYLSPFFGIYGKPNKNLIKDIYRYMQNPSDTSHFWAPYNWSSYEFDNQNRVIKKTTKFLDEVVHYLVEI